jgi:hypothetical protein
LKAEAWRNGNFNPNGGWENEYPFGALVWIYEIEMVGKRHIYWYKYEIWEEDWGERVERERRLEKYAKNN